LNKNIYNRFLEIKLKAQ